MCPASPNQSRPRHQTLDIHLSPTKQESDVSDAKDVMHLWDEAGNVVLLVVLYCLQGVPLGLSMGSMPFLLQANASYTSIGIFSMAAYPYSFKLLWSPIVDSVFHRRFGRRRTWIVPLQTLSALLLFYFGQTAEDALNGSDIWRLSGLFFILVLLAATQDIAVDGWALTLLSRSNLGYTSTCQTVGMNAGFFLSFTVFLALNDNDFCNKYFRRIPQETGIVTLANYMKAWGVIYAIVTLYIVLFKRERDDPSLRGRRLRDSYSQLWDVIKLPAVIKLSSVLLLCRLGSVVAEGAGTLKLLEKGVSKEALSGIVLIQFPIELFSAVLAGKWVAGKDAFSPFLFAYKSRLVTASLTTWVVRVFPVGAAMWFDAPMPFLMVLSIGVAASFGATLMFTAQGAFCSQVSDPAMGGAYLTLLNSIANLGSTLPRFIVFWLMDLLTVRECEIDGDVRPEYLCPSRKDDALESNACTDVGGSCLLTKDGFYPLSWFLIIAGCFLSVFFSKMLRQLQHLPIDKWHVKHSKAT